MEGAETVEGVETGVQTTGEFEARPGHMGLSQKQNRNNSRWINSAQDSQSLVCPLATDILLQMAVSRRECSESNPEPLKKQQVLLLLSLSSPSHSLSHKTSS